LFHKYGYNIRPLYNMVVPFNIKCKGKGKVHPRTGHEGSEGLEA